MLTYLRHATGPRLMTSEISMPGQALTTGHSQPPSGQDPSSWVRGEDHSHTYLDCEVEAIVAPSGLSKRRAIARGTPPQSDNS